MRRRRKGNPLLAKIVGITILLHLIALPILARLGVFQKVERQYLDAQMVVLPPPEKVRPVAKAVEHKAAPKTVRHSATNVASRSRTTASAHQNLSQPKVMAGPGDAGGSGDGGPGINPNGTGAAGQLPTAVATPTPKVAATPEPTATAAAPTPDPVREPPPAIPAPAATPAPAARTPVYADAIPTDSPKPYIPDALRSEALDATTIAEFTVGADGMPTTVRLAKSSGNSDLDAIALEAARRWRFRPATRDGQPVESLVRLHIEFEVR
jgi:protein TonB